MKLTVNLIGKQKRYRYAISVRTLVSMTVLSSLLMLISSRSTHLVSEDIARLALAEQLNEKDRVALQALEAKTEAQLSVVISQLAELNSQLSQLDQRSGHLAEALGMKAKDLEAFADNVVTEPVESVAPFEQAFIAARQSIDSRSRQIAMLESLVKGHHIHQQSQLSGRPVESGWLSSYYGMRKDPFSGTPAMHKGLDFAGATGDAVVTTAAGIVTWAGKRYGYGNLVEVEHKDGFVTRYGHNHSIDVVVGDVVTKGQTIARMGSTGRSTGAHVHYEVIRNGQPVDPLPFTRQ